MAESNPDIAEFTLAFYGIDRMYWRLHEHLNNHYVEGKAKRLVLSGSEVEDFADIVGAAQRVLSALDGGLVDPDPDSGGGLEVEGVARIEGNVIYPEAFHRQAA